MTEPVTAHTQRFVRCQWSLDRDLAYARHYPAVSWSASFGRDVEQFAAWHARTGDPSWTERRQRVTGLLAEAERLASLAELVGVGAMPGRERVVMLAGRLLREAVLQQSALSVNDSFCSAAKAGALVDAVLAVVDRCRELVDAGVPAAAIEEIDFVSLIHVRDAVGTRRRRRCRGAARPDAGAARGSGAMTTGWDAVEYAGIRELRGPLLIVAGVRGVGWDEFARIRLPSGEIRSGLVLEVDGDLAVVQVLEGTDGLDLADTSVTFSGEPATIPLSEGWLGRVCNGRGEPLDGGPPVLGSMRMAISGQPLNPTRREPPGDPVLTGVSGIDALTLLVRGQKLPIFSVAGLPHLELAAQIAAQAQVGDEPFCVVFAAMGLTHADAALVRDVLEERSAAGELVLLLNTADDPVIERILTPRIALTVAEHLAFTLGRHVLVVLADMTSYAEALREVSAARGEMPGRRGLPRLPLQRPRVALRALRPDLRLPGLGDGAAGAHDARRRHHPPGARPDRLHHRRPDRALAGGARPWHLPAPGPAVILVPVDAPRRRPGPHPGRPPRHRGAGALRGGPVASGPRPGRPHRGQRAQRHRAGLPGLRGGLRAAADSPGTP